MLHVEAHNVDLTKNEIVQQAMSEADRYNIDCDSDEGKQ